MKPAPRRLVPPSRMALALAVGLALAASLAGCSSGSDESLVDTTFDIQLTTGTGLRGVSMRLTHATDFELISLDDGEEPIASGSCSQNVASGEIRATCATTTSFAAPIDAWRVTLRHQSDRDLDQGIIGLTCEASDALGNTFAIGCQVVP